MGFFVDGVWQEDTDANRHERGRFVRTPSVYRNWITADGSAGPSGEGGFAAAPGRYHLYVSHSCPWAYRTTLFRKLKKLEDAISITIAAPLYGERSWRFADEPGCGPRHRQRQEANCGRSTCSPIRTIPGA